MLVCIERTPEGRSLPPHFLETLNPAAFYQLLALRTLRGIADL